MLVTFDAEALDFAHVAYLQIEPRPQSENLFQLTAESASQGAYILADALTNDEAHTLHTRVLVAWNDHKAGAVKSILSIGKMMAEIARDQKKWPIDPDELWWDLEQERRTTEAQSQFEDVETEE